MCVDQSLYIKSLKLKYNCSYVTVGLKIRRRFIGKTDTGMLSCLPHRSLLFYYLLSTMSKSHKVYFILVGTIIVYILIDTLYNMYSTGSEPVLKCDQLSEDEHFSDSQTPYSEINHRAVENVPTVLCNNDLRNV